MTIFQWVCIGLGIFLALPMIKKYLPAFNKASVTKAVANVRNKVEVVIPDEDTDDEWFELMNSYKHLRDCALKEECYDAVELLDQVFPKLNALAAKYPSPKSASVLHTETL